MFFIEKKIVTDTDLERDFTLNYIDYLFRSGSSRVGVFF